MCKRDGDDERLDNGIEVEKKRENTFMYQLLNRLVHLGCASHPYSSIVIKTVDLTVHKYLPQGSEMFHTSRRRFLLAFSGSDFAL